MFVLFAGEAVHTRSGDHQTMKKTIIIAGLTALACMASSCERVDVGKDSPAEEENGLVTLNDVAALLSSIDMGEPQFQEVFDAVNASTVNGYDEEYTMGQLFGSPGSGVGDTKAASTYEKPLKDLLTEAVNKKYGTKAGGDGPSAGEYLDELTSSDIQIYWPYSSSWDKKTSPVITFAPTDKSDANTGYVRGADGSVTEITVTEDVAKSRPVWVVNRNDDSEFKTLELLRREDPSWGEGGGEIVVKSVDDFKTLILRSFRMRRNYDNWFAGASEFFVKCGSADGFKASSDADLKLYSPAVTDFMIVVRRDQVDKVMPFNAVLVSEWTDMLQSCALIITEDDGGTRTSWKSSSTVKYKSKTYGFDIDIPINTRDDIVWRGQLTRNYIEKYSNTTGRFGDVDLVLELR